MKKNVLLFIVYFFSLTSFAQNILVTDLKCENKKDPSGVEKTSPVLSWQLRSTQRSVLQSAYRILVSDKPKLLSKNVGNIWDIKKINSDQSIQISYNGKKLIPTKTYYWKVLVLNNKGNSAWSKIASWQMGLPQKQDWSGAKWIALEKIPDSLKIIPALENRGPKGLADVKDVLPLLRKNFSINKPVKKATMFICGLGQFELSINGKKTGDHFLDPGWTQFDKESMYVTFDVTDQLQEGTNTIGVMLGNGFYFIPRQRYRKLTGAFGFPKMKCRLVIEYSDGSSSDIVSDGSWKTTSSSITFSSIYGGEDYNANLEQKGWNTPSFDDRSWKNVLIVDGPENLISQMEEPVKIMEIFSPQKINKIRDSVYVYDMSQNLSGIVSINVSGKKGDTIKIILGELLNADGTVTQRQSGSPYYFSYILKGGGVETWQPRFTYYGFRYLQVERSVPKGEVNPNNLPVMIEIKSLHTRNAAATIGEFSCSNELFNRTNRLIDWSTKSNMQSILTDCPHREKLGWLEQLHLMGSSIRYNYDVADLFKKMVHDMQVAQTNDGLIPEISPEYVRFDYGNGMFRDSPEWGSSCIILPWYLYQWYGDKALLAESYTMMQKYISYLRSKANDNILMQGLGDWYDLGPNSPGVSQLTPKGVTATAMYYYDLTIMSKIAHLLGKINDVNEYNKLALEVKNSFNKKFFNENTNQYATGSQTANAIAVYMDLVEEKNKNAVIENIIKDIRQNKNALTAGDIGYRYLLRVLENAGRSDVIYDMNSRTDVPGYGYQLEKGATSLTESWQALPTVSNNHLMLGHLMEWFYSGLCGIKQNKNSIAFKNIIIDPDPVGNVTWAKATYQSPYGLISSYWKKQNNIFELEVEIPANTTATIFLPSKNISSVMENNSSIANSKDIKMAGIENGKVKLLAGSGIYKFSIK